ncbi:MAG: Uma2 family endonuclease [Methylobacter sp.]|nr:Uma2 family endonuclease [Methylobacter sp.]MDP2098297.1 Uma2 family endonuclease [Methylobacter sp.]MDP2426794.1 Uma2 family endonuclease [Methylobacter sp.]MDP3054656.1 Uma2 family endonuclease [Methylobacter sp.]MDP3362464.1 Uma2 family endonuclease [Methylobacter sp.]
MAAESKQASEWISEEAYLQGELVSEIKHEYIDGDVYAMAGASKNHQRITGNVSRKFGNQLENTPCEPFASDIKVKVGSQFFYPDVMVVCEDENGNDYYTEKPVIIVEVLSKSTRRMDETAKKFAYQTLPTLKEYVLIEQDFVDVEVCRRSEGWVSRHYFMGDNVTFESVGLSLAVADIYQRVDNEDVISFVNSLNQP